MIQEKYSIKKRAIFADSSSSDDSDDQHNGVLDKQPPNAPIVEQQKIETNQQRNNEVVEYAKNKWVKIQYTNRIKRVFEPPANLSELIKMLRLRFKDLDQSLNEYSKFDPQINQELASDSDITNLMKYLTLSYKDSDDDDNEIHETTDLLDAFKYAEKRESKRVLKLEVELEPKRESQFSSPQKIDKFYGSDEEFRQEDAVQENVQVQQQQVEEKKDDQLLLQNAAAVGSYQVLVDNPQYFDQPLEYRFTEGITDKSSQYVPQYQPAVNYNNPQQNVEEDTSAFADMYEQKDKVEDKKGDMNMIGAMALLDQMESHQSQEDIDKVISSLQGRLSVRPEELQNQQQILQQIEAYKQMKKQMQEDEELARTISFQEQYQNNRGQRPQYGTGVQNFYPQQNQYPQQQQQQFPPMQQQTTFYGGQPFPQPIPKVLYKPQKQYNLEASLEWIKLDEKKLKPLGVPSKKKQNVIGDWLKNTFGDNKPDNLPETRMKLAVPVSGSQSYVKKLPNQNIVVLQWDINNQTQYSWESKSILRNHYINDVNLNPFKISKSLKPGRLYRFKLSVKIPKSIHLDKIFLRLRFENMKKEQFGDFLVGIIDLSNDLDGSFFQDSRAPSIVNNQSFAPSQQVSRAGTIVNVQDDNSLYSVASNMSDQGYATFDECVEALKQCNGNQQEAIRLLSYARN